MCAYLPSTEAERRAMLEALGKESALDFFSSVPAEQLAAAERVDLPEGMSELELSRKLNGLAAKNHQFVKIYRGYGAYNHYIPAIVDEIATRQAFVTTYTPYQAELSQGVLQTIFEYQTMICQLTGLDVSNASVYDGATAAAEAVNMCLERRRRRVLLSEGLHPQTIETIKSRFHYLDVEIDMIPLAESGETSVEALAEMLDEKVCGVLVAQPNVLGIIEPAAELFVLAKKAGAKSVLSINPIAAAILPAAAEVGADIAVGEGQPLGMPLSFGGPGLGFMAARQDMMRRLPGRIVGQTTDAEGRRAFVLTLQAREQHIRRERAMSNICSNQALCALRAGVYLTVMGPQGLREAAELSLSKAHYLAARLAELPGWSLRFDGEFFHEFVTDAPVSGEKINAVLKEHDILGGYPLEDGGMVWCCTETVTREDMDELVNILREVG